MATRGGGGHAVATLLLLVAAVAALAASSAEPPADAPDAVAAAEANKGTTFNAMVIKNPFPAAGVLGGTTSDGLPVDPTPDGLPVDPTPDGQFAVEKARKQQKQQVEQMHAANDGKENCQKDPDDEEVGKDLVGRVKNQLTSDGMTESVHRSITSESDKLKAVVAVERFESFGLGVQESFSDDVDESYEMYKDSDEEDDEGFEHKEELRRRRKLIPSWAGEENLDKILLSNQNLDPGAIFAHKRSFKLCDVLPLHIPQRRFN